MWLSEFWRRPMRAQPASETRRGAPVAPRKRLNRREDTANLLAAASRTGYDGLVMNQSILVVDDDQHIREVVCFALNKAGMITRAAADGAEGLRLAQEEEPDLLILDINMPEMDGLEVCRRIRQTSEVPILFLSSRDDEIDRVLGLELGADDYVTKPYNPRELMVRVKNLVQRIRSTGSGSAKKRPSEHRRLQFAEWQLNTGRRLLTSSENEQCQLTEGEYKLLTALIDHAGEVLSRDTLMNQIGGRDWFPNDRTIDVLIARLRKKLGDTRDEARIINTAHGTGYIFVAEVQHE